MEDSSTINTINRQEKIKNFFINNKNIIISGVIIIILILIGVYSYDNHITNKQKEISDNFNSIIIEYNQDNKETTANRLIEIVNKKNPTYSPLSLYFLIDNNLVNDQKVVNSLFDILIEKTSLDEEIKNLVIYKKALFNADQIEEIDLLNILNPLINSSSVWKSHALYLMAEYFYTGDQEEKAREFFNQIISLENPNSEIRLQVEKRLNRDLSE